MGDEGENPDGPAGGPMWSAPVVHVAEQGEGEPEGRILVELPGVRKGDVQLVLMEDRVEIEARGGFRNFKKTIVLPAWLAPSGEGGIRASMEDGLLIISPSRDASTPADTEGEPAGTGDGNANTPPSPPAAGTEDVKGGPGGTGGGVEKDCPGEIGNGVKKDGAGKIESGGEQSASKGGEPSPIRIGGNGAAGGAPEGLKQMDTLKDQLLRLRADFDNYRKRSRKDREDYAQRRITDILLGVLDVIDALDRGVDTSARCRDPDMISKGLELIQQQARSVLQSMDVRPVDPAGTPFDPKFHEAVESVKDEKREEGTVDSTLTKGYVFGGVLLRPARVRVIKNK